MDHGSAEPHGEEKLRLILDQITAIRSRLNALALQQGLFGGLTFILGAAVLIVGSAFAFGPLTFLMIGMVILVTAVAGVARTTGGAWRMRTSAERAARIADERAALKGRLTTMVDAARGELRSALWPYLVEDTLALREEFVAAKVEPRRVSRWLWAALVSCAAAAIVMRLAYRVRSARLLATNQVFGAAGEPTADLGDLDIRPADPSADPGTEIDADPATLRKLADKLREAQINGQPGSPTSRLMANARDAARALQSKLTGSTPADPASRLRLTDKKGAEAGKGQAQEQNHQADHPTNRQLGRPQANGNQENSQNSGGQPQSDQNQPQPNGAPTPALPDMSALAALNGLNSDDPNPGGSSAQKMPSDSRKLPQGGQMGTGGSDHGSGSDPRHLYGEAEQPPLGNDTFKIPVEAGPSEDGSSSTAPASPPQRIKSALNERQAPDQPFERASIPATDRVTIKRVFER
jgi:hypothetical protein